MGQFMGQQESAWSRMWVILVSIENDVVTNRVSGGIDSLCRVDRPCISMHAHPAEIVAEARLGKGACRCVERLPG
jgi:hypothetical protein